MDINFIIVNISEEFKNIFCKSHNCNLVVINGRYDYCNCELFEHDYRNNCLSRCFYRFTLDIDCYVYISSTYKSRYNQYYDSEWIADENIELEEGSNDEKLVSMMPFKEAEIGTIFYIKLKEEDKNIQSINKIFKEVEKFCDNHELKYNIELL